MEGSSEYELNPRQYGEVVLSLWFVGIRAAWLDLMYRNGNSGCVRIMGGNH